MGVFMRRIAAVALTTGALAAGMGAIATTAEAAPAPGTTFDSFGDGVTAGVTTTTVAPRARRWAAPNSFPRVSAAGKYTRGPRRVFGTGTVRDGGRDTWVACVRLKVTDARGRQIGRPGGGCIVDRNRRPVDAVAKASFSFNMPRGAHFYVQEARVSKIGRAHV